MPLNQLNLDGWQKYDHIDHYRSPLKRQESQQNLLLQRIWVSGAELQPGESQNGGLEMFGR